MRVLILGPVVNENTSGGVAVFDEGLCNGFKELGDESNILSIEKSSKLDNLVIKSNKPKPSKIPFLTGRIAKAIKQYKPDLVISSLQYSIGIKKYKRKWPGAKYIQVLHGFPCPINGKFKSWSVNKVAKYSRKHFNYVVTVSFLSYAINKKINKIICDRVIHNGCALIPNDNEFPRIYDFVYVGRLFKDKEVEMIGDAFSLLKKRMPKTRLVVVGYGELESMFTKGKFANSGIEFLGKKSQIEVRDILSKTKFFVSMNPLEPFGTVFNEAIMNGCNIVTQSTSGGTPLFMKNDFYHPADCTNADELCDILSKAMQNYCEIDSKTKQEYVDYLSFERCAKEYKSLLADYD